MSDRSLSSRQNSSTGVPKGTNDVDERTIGRWIAAASERHPERTFLLWQGERYDYRDLESITNRYANAFAQLGVRHGDRVAMLMRNRPEYLWALWGLGKLGAIPVTINVSARGELLAYFIAQSRSSLLIIADEFAGEVAALAGGLPDLAAVVLADSESNEALTAAGLRTTPASELEQADARRPALDRVDGADPGAIFYTSGTTGPSKGVLTAHSQPCALAEQIADYFQLTRDDVMFTCLPLFHVNAVWYTSYTALLTGASVALVERFSASRFWQQIDHFRATQFNFMGAMANILRSNERTAAERNNRVRSSLIGPATADVVELFRDRFGIEVITGYGSTELYLACRFRPLEVPEKIGTAGAVSPGGQLRIVAPSGEQLDPGEAGELQFRPDDPGWMMKGYFDMPEATAAAFADNRWFRTGDRGFLDEDGFLHFVDRIKDSIRRRGENISAFEIESQVEKHPAVQEVAAVPVPSELGEDEVMIWVVARPGAVLEPADLLDFCRERMGRYMVPRFVQITDELPKTPTNRIEKYKLRELAAERREQLWDGDRG